MKVRTRFAPSPTGLLHVGGARTALFNYLFARSRGGTFILRMEDTDRVRSRPEFEDALIEDMRWLGLEWDEGPQIEYGEYGPYRQSERGDIYRKLAKRLLEKNLAYRCFCTKERLQELKDKQRETKLPPRYDGRCRDKTGTTERGKFVLRFIIPDKEVGFVDLVHGALTFDNKAYGDFIIMNTEDEATYNFASAVDDGLMKISHVIRGDDHLSNTPRQILIMEALGLTPPLYAHVPLVLGADQKPLSKREADSGVAELRDKGYLPEAVLNAAARLGLAQKEGLQTLAQMAADFRIKKISKSPSIFEPSHLKNLNKKAISRLKTREIIKLSQLQDLTEDTTLLHKAVEAVRNNAFTLREFRSLLTPLLTRAAPEAEAVLILKAGESKALLEAVMEELDNGVKTYDALINRIKVSTGFKGPTLFMPLRCALTGTKKGIELDKIFSILGVNEVEERIKAVLTPGKVEAITSESEDPH